MQLKLIERMLLAAAVVSVLAGPASAVAGQPASARVLPRADVRFASSTSEVPNLQRHLLPLMGRLGCTAAPVTARSRGKAASGCRSLATTSKPITMPWCSAKPPTKNRPKSSNLAST